MCGIVGICGLGHNGAPVARAELASMLAQLRHRGPDGEGYLTRPGIGLGHARLSIIDLAGGQQPIHNEDRTIWTVFNGEIFNYVELRQELQARGHSFYTRSDTEVLVHLYEEYGEDFPRHLNGQFSIALWDSRRKRLILVRDRVGITPLFYTEQSGRLLFASEIKALLPVLGGAPRLDRQALDQSLTFWSPVAPRTLFENVRELPPGEMLVVDRGTVRSRRYWEWRFPAGSGIAEENEETLAEQLHALLVDATRIRLRADVPVGAYLSGGLDSSTIAALVRHHGESELRTFSVGFDDPALDEQSYQQMMIERLGADHSALQCSHAQVAERFPDAVWHAETNLLRTAPVPMAMLSGLVRSQGYKVVLTGEGADEVLGGYDLFKETKIRQFWASRPDSSWRPLLLKRLYPYLDLTQRQGQAYLQNFFGMALDTPDLPYFSHLPRWLTTAKCKMFLSAAVRDELREDALAGVEGLLPGDFGAWHSFHRAQFLEARTLMSGYLLSSQGDRMLMTNSVEGRFPFLDHRLIEFANRLPPKLKMRGLREKHLLKKAVAPYLPEGIVSRFKQPYRAPDIPAFFANGAAPAYVEELLSPAKLQEYGYFDPKRVGLLLKKIRAGRAIGHKDNMALVSILSTQMWHFHFVENYQRNFAPSGLGHYPAEKELGA